MIEGLSIWAEQIIVAVVIAGIIEMILPHGNSKKYIKVVIGVYILFTIISPILGKINNVDLDNIDYEKYFENTDASQTLSQDLSNNNNQSVEEIYINNLKQDMKSKLQEKGYLVDSVSLDIEQKDEQNYGKINKVNLYINKITQDNEKNKTNSNNISIEKIEKVTIGNTVKETNTICNLKENEKNEIKEYISSVYEVNKKNIKVNE